jgi:hypothetical protein
MLGGGRLKKGIRREEKKKRRPLSRDLGAFSG